MKNKKILLAVLAIALVLGMTACKDNEGDGGDTISGDNGDTISDNTIASGVTVANPPGIKDEVIEFSLCWSAGYDWPINECLNGSSSVTIKNGKLNMILGVPKDEHLTDNFDYVISYSKKIFFNIMEFYTVDGKYGLSCDNIEDREWAYLVYADEDVTVKKTINHVNPSDNYSYDISFKKGWNYFLYLEDHYISSTKLPDGYQWIVYKMGY